MRRLDKLREHGNVLLLLLVAVILAIALIYAVMSFSHFNQPKHAVTLNDATTVTQYSSALRTGVTRMLLRNIPVDELDFTAPVSDAYKNVSDASSEKMVFHPNGGGVSYSPVKESVVAQLHNDPSDFSKMQNGNWHFLKVRIAGVGNDAPELVAMLDDVTRNSCADINEQITGSGNIPEISADAKDVLSGAVLLTGPAIDRQPLLCVKTHTAYIYYHVLAEQ